MCRLVRSVPPPTWSDGHSALSVGHLSERLPSLDAAAIEVADDRRPVDPELRRHSVDQGPREVGAHEVVDGRLGQPPLHRV